MQRHLYPADWKERVHQADQRAGGRCERCGAVLGTMRVSRKGNLYFLPLHTCHVNNDPENPEAELHKLCPRCHWQTHPWMQGKRSESNRHGYRSITQERVLRAARSGGLAITPDSSGAGYAWEIGDLSGAAPDVLDAVSQALHCLRMEWLQRASKGGQHVQSCRIGFPCGVASRHFPSNPVCLRGTILYHASGKGSVPMISVDAIAHSPQCKLPFKYRCHVATESDLAELHHMAARLGLRPAWFHNTPTHPHSNLTPAKRAQAIRLGARAVRTHELRRALLITDTRQRVTVAHAAGSAMKTLQRGESTPVPDDGQTRVSPHEPMQRDATHHFLHSHSRKRADRAALCATVSRLSPSDSQVPPAFSRRFPSFEQAHMLQHFPYPYDGVRIHQVMWTCIETSRQEAGI